MKLYSGILILLGAALTLSLSGYGQDKPENSIVPVDEETGLITYKEVVQQEGTDDELYLRSIDWINQNFENPEDVTRVRNRENKVIKGLHRFKVYYYNKDSVKVDAGLIQYEFNLEFKDGRYRYTFNNYLFKDVSKQPIEKFLDKSQPAYNPMWDEYLKQTDIFTKEKIAALKKAMLPKVVKPDEW